MATEAQHLRALQIAHDVRAQQTVVRQRLSGVTDLQTARRELATLLDQPPTHIGNVRIARLLRWGFGIDERRAMMALSRASVRGSHKRVNDLTPDQRARLAAVLREDADRADGR